MNPVDAALLTAPHAKAHVREKEEVANMSYHVARTMARIIKEDKPSAVSFDDRQLNKEVPLAGPLNSQSVLRLAERMDTQQLWFFEYIWQDKRPRTRQMFGDVIHTVFVALEKRGYHFQPRIIIDPEIYPSVVGGRPIGLCGYVFNIQDLEKFQTHEHTVGYPCQGYLLE